MSFTQNFNYCMRFFNYSAYKLSKMIGVSNQAVLNWQSGKATPHKKMIVALADHFGISFDDLTGDELPILTEIEQKKEALSQDEKELSEAEEQMLSLFRQIPADKQSALVDSIEIALRMQGLL